MIAGRLTEAACERRMLDLARLDAKAAQRSPAVARLLLEHAERQLFEALADARERR